LSLEVAPKLHFGTFSASLGSLSTKVQRVSQVPVVVAAGLQSSVVYWQLEATGGHPIAGARPFYALLESSEEDLPLSVAMSAVVDIATERGVFRAATREHRDVPALVQHL
jgi:hypothetical protein